MSSLLRRLLLPSLLASLPVSGCAPGGEYEELGDIIDDSKGDSYSRPTRFGQLFQGAWQFAQLDPAQAQRMASFEFFLGADSTAKIVTHQAPSEEPTLIGAVIYLYKQREDGTWKRIAKSENREFGELELALVQGNYRIILTGLSKDDEGEVMVRLDVDGAGKVDDQCLLGEWFSDLRELTRGPIRLNDEPAELNAQSWVNPTQTAQIITAVNQSAHQVTTLAEAFAAVDQGTIMRYPFYDTLSGRRIVAFEYGAGDNSYGAVFLRKSLDVGAAINDGELLGCAITANACVFGRHFNETRYMPDMTLADEQKLESAAAVSDPVLAQQIIAAIATDGDITTIEEAFALADDSTFHVERYTHRDGRGFVLIRAHLGDAPVGRYFAQGRAAPLASLNDGEIEDCAAH